LTAHPPSSNSLKILAVDDDDGSKIALSMVLKFLGHNAVLAKDTEEALKLVENAPTPFDLIITDHVMPGLTGLDLVQRLRKKDFVGEIIVLSGYGGKNVEQGYKQLEVAGFMKKPFNLADLRQWMDCIQGCRKRLSKAQGLACPLKGIDFCWLKRD